MKNSSVAFERHFPIDYADSLHLQQQLFDAHIEALHTQTTLPATVLLCEHNPVVTLGKHANAAHVLSPQLLEARGIQQFPISRGGDVTFHGPGQLVVYPILNLKNHQLTVKTFVQLLEKAVIELLAQWGIQGEVLAQYPGVWVAMPQGGYAKVCALGLYCHQFVTMHGIALNVHVSLDYFSLICPCGIADKGVTSMAQILGREPDMDEVASAFQSIFIRLLL